MTWEIQYTEKARDDLRGIYEYIAYNFFVPMTAKKLVKNIMEDISKLDINPHIFPLYKKEPWFSRGLRFFMVKNYNVFYVPDESSNTVYIIRIMYGGRDIENELNN